MRKALVVGINYYQHGPPLHGCVGAPDGLVNSDDPWYYTCYTPNWQDVATFRGTDTSPKERFVYHNAGVAGLGGSSYIDDCAFRQRDANTNWYSAADGVLEERRYYLQNWRHDVVGVLTDTGAIEETVMYAGYGGPKADPAGDMNGDCKYDGGDSLTGGYDVRKDTNQDGTLNASDVTQANSITGGYQTLGEGVLTSVGVMNRKGYAGYELMPELLGTKYLCGHRVLDAERGVWTRRDPIFRGSQHFYDYVDDAPMNRVDPAGLIAAICQHDSGSSKPPPIGSPWAMACWVRCADPTTYGETLCGRRNSYCCVCDGNITRDYPDGDNIVSDCTDEGESSNYASCSARPGQSQGCCECSGYQVTLQCLQRRLPDCPSSRCIEDVLRAMQNALKGISNYCPGCT
jgi:RHS repeat-associated protein